MKVLGIVPARKGSKRIVGKNVRILGGKPLCQWAIEAALLAKKIDRLVVSSGGVLGVGGHRVAIPVDRFTWDAEKGAFKLPEDVASVKSMPEWVEGAQTATGSSQPPRNEPRIPPSGAGDSGSPAR